MDRKPVKTGSKWVQTGINPILQTENALQVIIINESKSVFLKGAGPLGPA